MTRDLKEERKQATTGLLNQRNLSTDQKFEGMKKLLIFFYVCGSVLEKEVWLQLASMMDNKPKKRKRKKETILRH